LFNIHTRIKVKRISLESCVKYNCLLADSAIVMIMSYVCLSVCPWQSVRNNNVGINYTLRRHTDLDFCRHQQGWPWMTLNARFNLTCVCRTVC